MNADWWYRIWWRGFSGRVHRFKHKVRKWNGSLITANGWGLPPAIERCVVKSKKVRRVKRSER